jgi:hypothetical protein
MKLKGIKISREAKILFGLMCLAAAILIWVNFATQRQGGFALFSNQEATLAPSSPTETTSPVDAVTPGAVTPDGAAPATTDPTATVDGASVLPNVDVTAVAPDGTTTATPDAVALPAETTPAEVTPATEVTPTVVAAAPIAARDVQLAELPFLVTEAPVEAALETTEEVVAETTRPGEQRATVNPFSPIVLAPVEAPAAQVADVPSNDVQVVTVPDAPPAIGTVDAGLAGSVIPIETGPIIAEGPLPEAVIPAPAVASLPRPLPTATSPVAPDILRNMSRTPEIMVVSDPVAETEPQILEVPAAIREPGQVVASVAPAILAPSVASPESAEVELEPVGSLASVTEATETSTAPASNGAPLFAGASPLSSYLRNNDVRFTGYAIGPVSVGIFRSLKSANPVVVTLGQTLPETEFVLTSLQGKEAEFSYGQEKQLLTLDLRR